ncbi:hypothetical protein [Neobacillus citreus]|uniref:Uncharacterized protein n=1 Tax=Neobacillus citreus TaxID=2833578 RepID=A0A942T5V3_9BACI|nr:hypothetical protein [Neobacillus citreus]MCH6265322.1 hypothetical protein [Neobacillus citreus]
MSIEQHEAIGHTLKKITIRYDFRDLMGFPQGHLRRILKICDDSGLTNIDTTNLNSSDFIFSDQLTTLQPPHGQLLHKMPNYVFYNDDESLNIEINQYFLRITHNVVGDLIRFNLLLTLFKSISEVITEIEEFIPRRLSLTKINEVLYKNLDHLISDFKEEQFGTLKELDWSKPTTFLRQNLNFEEGGFLNNITRQIESGTIKEDSFIRLLLQFEILCFDYIDKNPEVILDSMNKNLWNLYLKHVTPNGEYKLENGGKFGEKF